VGLPEVWEGAIVCVRMCVCVGGASTRHNTPYIFYLYLRQLPWVLGLQLSGLMTAITKDEK
jgi:hypothetical protein